MIAPDAREPVRTVRRSEARTRDAPMSFLVSRFEIVGHKTESVYRRYAIVDEAMQREAAARLDSWARMPHQQSVTGEVTQLPKAASRKTGTATRAV
jgi:hypothetical protein